MSRSIPPLRTRRSGTAVMALAAAWTLAPPLAAHDYWLEPSRFWPAAGEPVLISHRVGERLAGEPVARNPLAIVRFDLVAADGSITPVPGREGVDPAGFLNVGGAGRARIVFQSTRSFVELLPEKFSTYLAQEGLEKVERERQRLGKGKELAREAYSRSAAALLCIGARDGAAAPSVAPTAPAGLDLEIVPDTDLCSVKAGAPVGFRVLFRGKPIEGLLAMALSRTHPSAPQAVRTDRHGHVVFQLDKPGFWLIKAVEMRPLAGEPKAEWESFWASLTFELAASAP